MLILQIFILSILLFLVPIVVGSLFFVKEGAFPVEKRAQKIPFMWISGQILLWSGFFFICVPMILLEQKFVMVKYCFCMYAGLLFIIAFINILLKYHRGRHGLKVVGPAREINKKVCLLWLLVVILLVLQLVAGIFLAYEEGDDAYYVAISTITVDSDVMYSKLPYTGGTTELDVRHGLAPFPVWISLLSSLSKMHPVTVAQIALPLVLIFMSYVIYYLIGIHLFPKKKESQALFMIFIELMVVFGGYSVYSAENFLLVRTAQGKAVLANIVIPFLFYLFLLVLEKQGNEHKVKLELWMMIGLTMITGCLCSTLGALLTCLLMGIFGLCMSISYRRLRPFVGTLSCCVVPVVVAALYFLLG